MIIHPERSARPRNEPSSPAKLFWADGPASEKKPHASVLDWGCGRGEDVNWFNHLGLNARGYDPHAGYIGINRTWLEDDRVYDYITCFYVLNVITPKKDRASVLIDALEYLSPSGTMFIAVRSKARMKNLLHNWRKYRDGFITQKDTFQHGFTHAELKKLVESVGLSYTRWGAGRFMGCIATRA